MSCQAKSRHLCSRMPESESRMSQLWPGVDDHGFLKNSQPHRHHQSRRQQVSVAGTPIGIVDAGSEKIQHTDRRKNSTRPGLPIPATTPIRIQKKKSAERIFAEAVRPRQGIAPCRVGSCEPNLTRTL